MEIVPARRYDGMRHCQYWRKPGTNWTNAAPADNRADLEALVGGEPAPGLVAVRHGTAIGWVGLGPREAFPRLARSRTLPQLPGEAVWSINCFVVARKERGRGVGDALLRVAADYSRENGARLLEGFPVETSGGRQASGGDAPSGLSPWRPRRIPINLGRRSPGRGSRR